MISLVGFFWLLQSLFSPAWAGAADQNTPSNGRAIVPLLNFTTDRGLGYGAYGAWFVNGPDVPSEAPYSLQVGAQFYRTTGGYQDHKLVFDVPALSGGRLRAGLDIGWERWDQAYYFGQGNRLPRTRPEDTPKNRYAFGLNSVRAVSNVRWQLFENWHVFGGLLVRTASISVYRESLLEDDAPIGTEGGVLTQVYGGLMFDTRDHEFAPRSGLWTELSVRTAQHWMGSEWQMWGWNLTHRQYWSLGSPRWVFAFRGAVDQQRGQTPFFHQIVMGGSEWVDLGGPLAMRGLPIGRYRGEWTVYGDAELRWEMASFSVRGAGFRLFGAPFLSGAHIIQPGETAGGLHPHGGVGAGLRLLYNEVLQARFDVAAGREEYQVSQGGIESKWIPAFYLAFNMPY